MRRKREREDEQEIGGRPAKWSVSKVQALRAESEWTAQDAAVDSPLCVSTRLAKSGAAQISSDCTKEGKIRDVIPSRLLQSRITNPGNEVNTRIEDTLCSLLLICSAIPVDSHTYKHSKDGIGNSNKYR